MEGWLLSSTSWIHFHPRICPNCYGQSSSHLPSHQCRNQPIERLKWNKVVMKQETSQRKLQKGLRDVWPFLTVVDFNVSIIVTARENTMTVRTPSGSINSNRQWTDVSKMVHYRFIIISRQGFVSSKSGSRRGVCSIVFAVTSSAKLKITKRLLHNRYRN